MTASEFGRTAKENGTKGTDRLALVMLCWFLVVRTAIWC
ncbi:DUF1501 domain-containing protein [Vibrio lentus]|nr:DUF1501 domain-containing protein [Vibrio lentus]